MRGIVQKCKHACVASQSTTQPPARPTHAAFMSLGGSGHYEQWFQSHPYMCARINWVSHGNCDDPPLLNQQDNIAQDHSHRGRLFKFITCGVGSLRWSQAVAPLLRLLGQKARRRQHLPSRAVAWHVARCCSGRA